MPQDNINDLDNDGKINSEELEVILTKRTTQRKLAVAAFICLVAIAAYVVVLAPVDRIEALAGTITTFFVVFGGIIATYMGSEAWIQK